MSKKAPPLLLERSWYYTDTVPPCFYTFLLKTMFNVVQRIWERRTVIAGPQGKSLSKLQLLSLGNMKKTKTTIRKLDYCYYSWRRIYVVESKTKEEGSFLGTIVSSRVCSLGSHRKRKSAKGGSMVYFSCYGRFFVCQSYFVCCVQLPKPKPYLLIYMVVLLAPFFGVSFRVCTQYTFGQTYLYWYLYYVVARY